MKTTELDRLEITASARTEGVVTNRVVMQRPPKRAVPKRDSRGVVTHERGRPYRVLCVSIYVADLDIIDRAAAEARMSRSAFIRAACLAYAKQPEQGIP